MPVVLVQTPVTFYRHYTMSTWMDQLRARNVLRWSIISTINNNLPSTDAYSGLFFPPYVYAYLPYRRIWPLYLFPFFSSVRRGWRGFYSYVCSPILFNLTTEPRLRFLYVYVYVDFYLFIFFSFASPGSAKLVRGFSDNSTPYECAFVFCCCVTTPAVIILYWIPISTTAILSFYAFEKSLFVKSAQLRGGTLF